MNDTLLTQTAPAAPRGATPTAPAAPGGVTQTAPAAPGGATQTAPAAPGGVTQTAPAAPGAPPPAASPRAPSPNRAAATARATRAQRLALLAGLAIAAWLVLRLFASILLPFVAAAGIAYFLHPLATRLAALGLRRNVAAFLVILMLGAIVALSALLLYPLTIAQVGVLVARVPAYANALRHFADHLISQAQAHLGTAYVNARLRDLVAGQAGTVVGFFSSAIARIVGGGFALFNVLSLVLVTPVVAFYLLRDWPAVIDRLDAWLPRRYAGSLRAQAAEVDRILSAWVRGQLICCLLLALFYAVGLSLAGLDLGLIVGLLAGGLSFIPYVGTITGAVSSVALAFAQFSDWRRVAIVAAVFLAGQLLEGYVIYPRFLGNKVELHAVWVIFALFAGGAAFGFVGVMLAVPMAATIGVLTRYWLDRYLRSPLYLDPP